MVMDARDELKKYLIGKTILIVGGGPGAACCSSCWYSKFDIIVRCNNYQKSCNARTDIFVSYFGENITKSKEELIADGVKFAVCNCPNADMSEELNKSPGQQKDFHWIYEFRKDWWFCPVVGLTKEELVTQVGLLDGYMPSVGLSAVLFFEQFCSPVNIIGFDCFESGLHDLNKKWDRSGEHNPQREKQLLKKLEQSGKLIWHAKGKGW